MSEIMDDISYLSQEIGPRPAGTEEEQQAALYIADQIQKRTGFTANIEDFNAATQPGLVEAICFGIAALISLLAIVFGALAVPAFLITLACAILYAFEVIDRPMLSHVFERGVSQNVVARYKPGMLDQARGRKVVLVANYDSSKVQSELNGALFGLYPMLQKASAIALIALPVIWLFRMLFSGGALFFNLLAAIALILALIPVALFFMHKASTYNEAANNNAAGVATLLKVAQSIADGSYSEEELAAMANKSVHGAEEAYAAGVVPEGAELEYAENLNMSEEERLASAKAAVAALTGQPLREYQVEQIDFTPLVQREDIELYNEDMDYGEYAYNEDEMLTEQLPAVDASGRSVARTEAAVAPVQEAAADEVAEAEVVSADTETDAAEVTAEVEAVEEVQTTKDKAEVVAAPVPAAAPALTFTAPAPAAASNEPEWYTTGRAKAVKPVGADNVPIRRSRYADALDAAVAASREHMDQAARMLDEGTIERISEMKRNLEAKNAAAGVHDVPLQDLLSDEYQAKLRAKAEAEAQAQAQEAAEAEAEASAVANGTDEFDSEVEVAVAEIAESDGVEAVETETGASSAEETVEAETAEAETSDETGEVADVTEVTEEAEETESVEAAESTEPSESTEEDLRYATVAMDPIDVGALREEDPDVSTEEKPARDFSQIGAPARRYRDIALAHVSDTAANESNAPARYGNPLQSERIPRITETPAQPISVMEEIQPTPVSAALEPQTESIEEKRAALRQAIPSLSGEFSPVVVAEPGSAESAENTEVSKTGSFATASSAVPFEPVGDELVADLAPEERYVEDADDTSYDENTTETGAFAGPGYVEMPESRLSRFFSRFRKKPEVEEESTNEWLDVDDSFSAREVGAARGSWESFRQDVEETVEDVKDAFEDVATDLKEEIEEAVDDVKELFDGEQETLFDEYEYVDVDEEERSWHGGAFSQMRTRLMRDASTEEAAAELVEEAEAATEVDIEVPDGSFAEIGADFDAASDQALAANIEDAPVSQRAQSPLVPLVDIAEEARIAEETKMVYSFRNPDINTEVWFVALGAEYAGNGGMKAFLAEHADELRGAIIINLEAMGAGQLSFIEEEGLLTTNRPSSRLKRYLQKAGEVTGVRAASASLPWRESAASLAMKRGLQAMTLAGIEAEKPAYMGQGDDVLENIDEATIEANAQFILELIKNI